MEQSRPRRAPDSAVAGERLCGRSPAIRRTIGLRHASATRSSTSSAPKCLNSPPSWTGPRPMCSPTCRSRLPVSDQAARDQPVRARLNGEIRSRTEVVNGRRTLTPQTRNRSCTWCADRRPDPAPINTLKAPLGRILYALRRRRGSAPSGVQRPFCEAALHAVSVRRASDQTRIAYWDLRTDTLLFERLAAFIQPPHDRLSGARPRRAQRTLRP